MTRTVCAILVAGGLAAMPATMPRAMAQVQGLPGAPLPKVPYEERGLDVEEKVGSVLPLELQFTRSDGRVVSLSEYFAKGNKKPAVMALVYYHCPVVCRTVMDKLASTLEKVDYTVGTEYNVVIVSIDPNEHPNAARDTQRKYLETYSRWRDAGEGSAVRAPIEAGWNFHVSPDAKAVEKLADAVGFRYKFLEDTGQYSHPVVLFMITPDGQISRYLYGYEQDPRDMKLALMEASEGKLVRTIGERIMNFCYMFDPTRGTFTLQAFRVMQLGGGATLVLLGGLIGGMLLWERSRQRRRAAAMPGGGGEGSGVRTPGAVA